MTARAATLLATGLAVACDLAGCASGGGVAEPDPAGTPQSSQSSPSPSATAAPTAPPGAASTRGRVLSARAYRSALRDF